MKRVNLGGPNKVMYLLSGTREEYLFSPDSKLFTIFSLHGGILFILAKKEDFQHKLLERKSFTKGGGVFKTISLPIFNHSGVNSKEGHNFKLDYNGNLPSKLETLR
jgi:hypothetical protein